MFPFFKAKETAQPTVLEAALPMNTSHDALRGHLRNALMAHHSVANTYDSQGPWIQDTFPKHVVYSFKGQTLKQGYSVGEAPAGQDPTVTLAGKPTQVHVAYMDTAASKEGRRVILSVPEGYEDVAETVTVTVEGDVVVRESVEFYGEQVDMTTVQEAAGGKKSIVPICIIKPGWGSMAHYSESMLKTSGPKAFKKGTQMFMNHATESEELQRPEGDLNQLAAVLNKDAYWDQNGAKGPGLYSEAILFSDHADKILEKGPYTGCSINAAIKATEGTVDGRSGKIATEFVRGYSVDFVTKAGAGGAPIVPVTESAKGSASSGDNQKEIPMDLTKEQIAALEADNTKLKTENSALSAKVAVMEAQQNRILAMATVGMLLKEAGVEVKSSLIQRVCESPKMEADGTVNKDWAKATFEDLSSVGEAGGRVHGLGERTKEGRDKASEKDAEDFKESMKSLGVPEAGLKYALSLGRG